MPIEDGTAKPEAGVKFPGGIKLFVNTYNVTLRPTHFQSLQI